MNQFFLKTSEAAIDIGTNTILLLISRINLERKPIGPFQPRVMLKTLENQMEFVRLGENVRKSKSFSNAAMDRAFKCLEKYLLLCQKHHVSTIYAVATSASRQAKNAREFFATVKDKLGLSVQIISGEKEAELSFLGGILSQYDPTQVAIMDIGGGSTEFVCLNTKLKLDSISLHVGCVSLTEQYLRQPCHTARSLHQIEAYLLKKWEKTNATLAKALKHKPWICVAGTPTTLAALDLNLDHFDEKKLDGYILKRESAEDLLQKLLLQPEEQRKINPIIGKGRADVIIEGSLILLSAMRFFNKTEVIVSTRGIRHGLLLYPEILSA